RGASAVGGRTDTRPVAPTASGSIRLSDSAHTRRAAAGTAIGAPARAVRPRAAPALRERGGSRARSAVVSVVEVTAADPRGGGHDAGGRGERRAGGLALPRRTTHGAVLARDRPQDPRAVAPGPQLRDAVVADVLVGGHLLDPHPGA